MNILSNCNNRFYKYRKKNNEKNKITREKKLTLKIALTSLKINRKNKKNKKKIIVLENDEFLAFLFIFSFIIRSSI